MPDTDPQRTLDTDASTFRLHRLESAWLAWHAGEATPSWQQHLPADDEPCKPEWIFNLLKLDIECRIKAGLPALLAERYFEHPRLQRDDARLDDALQVQLIHGEYSQRLQNGQRPRRAEYEAAFPQHREALREMKPRSRCKQCEKIFILEETFQTWLCPDCGCESTLLPTAPPLVEPIAPPAATSPHFDLRGYELLEVLGQGGMGEVYHCCDPALERDLAIKVVLAKHRGDPHVERRFLREARITGSLQHPGIVPIHNLGRLPDGRLHYTMRLLRGSTFAEILREKAGQREHLPNLLSIFEKICQAVAYAHSKRVIHRDLKPSNVKVGKFGEVQVLDWGLAKKLTPEDAAADAEELADAAGTRIPTEADAPADLSRIGVGFGTLAYMPREQALGQWDIVDERADVFALGSILCEILTGQPAYSGDDNDFARRVKRGDVAEALGRLQRCGADAALTALCRECLSPQPEDRPRDAAAVAKRVADYQAEVQERLRQAEVERAAAQLKVREGRKRRRLLLALVVALLVGGGVITWLAVRATEERDAKENALGDAKAAAEAEAAQRKKAEDSKAEKEFLLNNVLAAGRPKGQEGGLGLDVKLSDAIDRAEGLIADSFKGRPLAEASIRNSLGETYDLWGEYPKAIGQHEKALALREANLGPYHPDTFESHINLAQAYRDAGRIAKAIELYEPTLKQMEDKLPEHDYTLICRNNLADAYYAAGRYADAIHLNEQTLEQRKAKYGLDHLETLISCINLGEVYRSAGRTADAIGLLEPTLKQMKVQRGPEHPDTLTCRNNLALAYLEAGRAAEAIAMLELTLKQREDNLGHEHPAAFISRNSLAFAYLSVGRIAEATRLLEPTLKQMEAKLGPEDPDLLTCRNNLALAKLLAGHAAEAIPFFERTLKQREAKLGPDHPDTLDSRSMLAGAYCFVGRTAEAIQIQEQTLRQREAKLGSDQIGTLLSKTNLGMAYLVDGQDNRAIQLLEETWERGRKRSGGFPTQLIWFVVPLAEIYDRKAEFKKAEVIYSELLETARQQIGPEEPITAGLMTGKGFHLLRQERYSEAETLLRQCLKVCEAKQPDEWGTFNVHSLLGAALLGQKKFDEAERQLLQGYEGMKQREAKIPPEGKIYLTDALERLVQLYEAIDQKEKAVPWQKKWDEAKSVRKKAKP